MEREKRPNGQDDSAEPQPGEEDAHPMDVLMEEETFGLETPARGEIRMGTIARITENDILVDIGYKSEGIIYSREVERLPEEKLSRLKVGEEVEVYVVATGDPIKLSLIKAEEIQDWTRAEDLYKNKEIFEGTIAGYNKGGLIVSFGRLRGFVPASQVSYVRRRRWQGSSPDERWGEMVGETFLVRVIEVDQGRNRLILSEKAAAREARDLRKDKLIAELEEGEIRAGRVMSLADFGAFVDIGGADGLVHTSEITWKRISHPREVLEIGQEVRVKVLGVDAEQKRISLSLRELEDDPWEKVLEKIQEGQLVEGTITKLTKFGAFARLEELKDYGLEGLIHISELADRHIAHPREVVQEGEIVTLRIIRVDNKQKRIGLSLKQVDSAAYAELDWQVSRQDSQEEAPGSPEVPTEAPGSEVPQEHPGKDAEPLAEAEQGDESEIIDPEHIDLSEGEDILDSSRISAGGAELEGEEDPNNGE
jgi:small subunit ribosomal protein S1